jgi:putative pyruvate formate lyase activating enzyme
VGVSTPRTWPAYLELYESGELARRADEAVASLATCRVCPRDCKVDRLADQPGAEPPSRQPFCNTGRRARVSTYFAHFGEEDCLRGTQGSGTIFFAFCNLRCTFCQNWDTSQDGHGDEVSAAVLAEMMLDLQDRGCHNVNFVTPEHVVPQVLEALVLAVRDGLRLPLVYNTSGYDALESLAWLDGVVDVYMPDFKVWEKASAIRYLKAKDYRSVACAVLHEMQRQVGPLELDAQGLARRGVLVRHLVMPGLLEETGRIFEFLAREVSPETYVNVMGQYRPEFQASDYPEIDRRPTSAEMAEARRLFLAAGLTRLDERGPLTLPLRLP